MLSAQPKNFNDETTFKNKTPVLTELDKYRNDSPESAGEILQVTRKQKKLKVDEIAALLNISPRFIKAIESMEIDQLPEKVYTLGFIRSYAKYLDLDSQKLVDEFRTKFYGNKASVFEDLKPNLIQTNLPSKKTIIFSSIMLIITVIIWFIYQKNNLVPHSKTSFKQPVTLSNIEEFSHPKILPKNSSELATREDNAQKGASIDKSSATLPPREAVENPYSKSDIVTQPKILPKNSSELATREDNAQKGASIDKSSATLPPREAVENPYSKSDIVTQPKILPKNSSELVLREDNAQKGANIDKSSAILPPREAVENPYSKPDIVTQNRADSQLPVIITPTSELPTIKSSANNQSSSIEVKKLPPPESQKTPPDNVINFQFLPRSDAISQ